MKTESTDNKVNSRRKFLQKSSAGVVIASLPAKSVWANGIAGSIVASGHSSDWASRNSIVLRDGVYIRSTYPSFETVKFSDYFPNGPIGGTVPNETDPTMLQVYEAAGSYVGIENKWMILLLANALADEANDSVIKYPVIAEYGGSVSDYANALYNAALTSGFVGQAEDMFFNHS